MSTKGLDQVADAARGGVELYRLAQVYEFPEFVKNAEFAAHLAPGRLNPAQYADPVRGQFPCHTKEATWLSALFYTEKQAEYHPKDRELVGKRLEARVNFFGIKAAVDKLAVKRAELAKAGNEDPLPDSAYAYVWVGEDGVKDRRLPIRSAAEVKAAAEWLETYRDQIPFADRSTIARKVLEKGAAYGADLTAKFEFLEKQAGRGVCDPQEVAKMLADRALLVPPRTEKAAEMRTHMAGLAAAVRESPSQALHPDRLVKLAAVIDQFDRDVGLAGKYTSEVPRPEDVIFSVTFAKAAADMKKVVATASGAVWDKAELKKLALDDIEAVLGTEFAGEVGTALQQVDAEKLAEQMEALPAPDVRQIESLLRERGIGPVMTKAASVRTGLSRAEKAVWAEQYAASR